MSVGKMLKKRRIELGIQQMDIAKKLGYGSAQFISNWERGISNPPPKVIKRLAKILEIDPEIIYDEIEQSFSRRLRA